MNDLVPLDLYPAKMDDETSCKEDVNDSPLGQKYALRAGNDGAKLTVNNGRYPRSSLPVDDESKINIMSMINQERDTALQRRLSTIELTVDKGHNDTDRDSNDVLQIHVDCLSLA